MKKNKLELTDKEYDALRALLYQTTTSAYAKAVGYAVFMAAHLELFPETYKTLKEINNKINLETDVNVNFERRYFMTFEKYN